MLSRTYEVIGATLAVAGAFFSLTGALVNNIWLLHVMAMQFWMISNPLLFVWAYGYHKKYWNGGISVEALGVMYLIFTISNFYGLALT